MSSFDRKHQRATEKRAVELQRIVSEVVTLDALLFGTAEAPTDEHLDVRRLLIARWRALMTEYGAHQPAKLRDYLYRAYETYDVDRDGQSKAMQLIWDIETLKELEAEHANAAQQGHERAHLTDRTAHAEEDGVQRRADDVAVAEVAGTALRQGPEEA